MTVCVYQTNRSKGVVQSCGISWRFGNGLPHKVLRRTGRLTGRATDLTITDTMGPDHIDALM